MSYYPSQLPPTPDNSHDESNSQDEGPSRKRRKANPDTLSIQERKLFFILSPTDKMKEMMEKYVADMEALFGASLPGGDCWLHPWPPETADGVPAGLVKCHFSWNDQSGHHKLDVNYGIVSLIVNHQLTSPQIRGFIDDSWQLSHLCGNWTCCNWKHYTVEHKCINCTRNGCFSSNSECLHSLRCIEEKKRRLLLRQMTRRKIYKGLIALELFESHSDLETSLMKQMRLCHRDHTKGHCNVCHHDHILRPLCSILRSRKKSEALLNVLASWLPTAQIRQATKLMKMVCEDLSF